MTEKTVDLVMEIAQRMVESGAEIGRVEESLTRICAAYGCLRTEAYATLSNLILTVETAEGRIFTQTRRIKQASPDMERLHLLNDLVRYMSRTAPEEAYVAAELEKIRRIKTYPAGIQIFFYAVIAGSFCVFFGGREPLEIVAAFLCGGVVGVLGMGLDVIRTNRILNRFVCSLFSSLVAVALARWNFVSTPDNIIIGNIMSLISGIGLTNSLRDLFTGDTITGLLRLMEAILLAAAIALGFWAAIYLLGGVA